MTNRVKSFRLPGGKAKGKGTGPGRSGVPALELPVARAFLNF